ncbi:MAG: tetratricopeptide repeat protein [Spirochaetaceae bacterium]|nr:tetratricopeptide repeat protein [Spirochaetaceae bacterium]
MSAGPAPCTRRLWLALSALVLPCALLFSCAFTSASSAEEYFALGMAYFDLGNYSEAEKWLVKARQTDKTKTASEYNLGRIAFESGRFTEAAAYFETILTKDPENIMALKAAAYTKIKQGDAEGARSLYGRVLALVPESADDGYNYALVLAALEMPEEAEAVLARYTQALKEKPELLLIYAHVQDAQNKVQALDSYALLLETDKSAALRFEYAAALEKHTFYARALEQYQEILKTIPEKNTNPSRPQVAFALARLLLLSDPQSEEGITELQNALSLGTPVATVKTLLEEPGITEAHKEAILLAIDEHENPQAQPDPAPAPQEEESAAAPALPL